MAAKKKPKTRTLSGPMEAVMEKCGIKDASYQEHYLDQAAGEATQQFMREWQKDRDEDETLSDAALYAAEDAVSMTVQQDYSDSYYAKRREAFVDAAQALADDAGIESQFEWVRKDDTCRVTIDQSFLKAWAEETEGQGFVAWDPSLGLKDVSGVASVINVLESRADVYGDRHLEARYEDQFDRWEPGAGLGYWDLVKIAEQAAVEAG